MLFYSKYRIKQALSFDFVNVWIKVSVYDFVRIFKSEFFPKLEQM